MSQIRQQDTSIALCLSGGGLRAALFHLGVVKALRAFNVDGKRALERVVEVYSVSGGSILAAHLIKNWDRYIGDNESFAKVEKEVLELARRNVRNRVFRRWILFSWNFGPPRNYLLRREYEQKFLGQTTIAGCYGNSNGAPPPRLNILATSFTTGELCAFTPDSFEVSKRHPTTGELSREATTSTSISLSFAVAASSAFPPAFPPLALDWEKLETLQFRGHNT
jgi:predicted acylesterase/phospholipase RssA